MAAKAKSYTCLEFGLRLPSQDSMFKNTNRRLIFRTHGFLTVCTLLALASLTILMTEDSDDLARHERMGRSSKGVKVNLGMHSKVEAAAKLKIPKVLPCVAHLAHHHTHPISLGYLGHVGKTHCRQACRRVIVHCFQQ